LAVELAAPDILATIRMAEQVDPVVEQVEIPVLLLKLVVPEP
jgi:hypothetical protein